MTANDWPSKVSADGGSVATLVDAYETETHHGARYRISPDDPPRAFTVPQDFAPAFEPHHLAVMVTSALEEGW